MDDVWDDSLVMKTWDESMRLAKEDVAKRLAQATNKTETDTSAGERKLDWEPVSNVLKKGDFCRATYREDGIDYEAVIVSVSGERCLIKFLGYGNEQYNTMKDLVSSWGEEFRMDQIEAATKDAEVGESTEEVDSNASTMNSERETTSQAGFEGGEKRSCRRKNKRKFKHPVPPMPPMPPTGDDNLHAMLMAWYMSGYYTGVYDAQQGSKRK